MGSLLGSKGNKGNNSNSSGGQQTASTVQNSQGTQSSQSSTTPGFIEELQAVLADTRAGTTGFTKQDAINDVQGVLRTQATDALQSVMPGIARTQSTAGAYNSTTKELLQNDANARITGQLAKTAADTIAQYQQIQQGNIGAFADASKAGTSQQSSSTGQQTSSSNAQSQGTQWAQGQGTTSGGGSGLLGLFADGGQVPQKTGSVEEYFKDFLTIPAFQDALTKATAAVSNPSAQTVRETTKAVDSIGGKVDDFLVDSVLGFLGFQDGGQVPTEAGNKLMEAIKKYQQGGQVRSGESDVQSGGKIKGPQSPTGEDNQVIGVAGGEGILAADVMEVPGVAELVKSLNDRFHTPTNK